MSAIEQKSKYTRLGQGFLIFFLWMGLLSIAKANDEAIFSDKSGNGPHHSGLLSSVNLGLRYSSLLQNRGVVSYRDFQVDPVVGVFLLDDRLEFLGDSLDYRDFVAGDWLRLRTKFASITDSPLFPSVENIKNSFPHRSDTYEWSNSAEFFLPGYNQNYFAEIDITYAKDISIHHGNYFEILGKLKLGNFQVPRVGTEIEPNFLALVGWGDSNHNQYYYGSSAKYSGFNNIAYGLWFTFPKEADRYYPIIQIKHFQTLGENGHGEYAEGRNEGWLLSFIATYGVLE